MPVYEFTLGRSGPFVNGATGAIVVAANTTDAKVLVKENNRWATPAQWDAATLVNLSAKDAAGFHMIVNVGTVASCNITGVAADTINSLSTAAAAAIAASGTLTGVSASSNVINFGTASAVGALAITGSIVDAAGNHITGFDPTINSVGTSAAARSVTWPTTALEWPVVVPIKESVPIPT